MRGTTALLFLVLKVATVAGCGAPAAVSEVEEVPIGVAAGLRAPDLTGTLPTGDPFRLGPDRSGPTVLVFYRSAHCGLCRVQLDQLQSNLPAYRGRGVRVIGVTLDPPALSASLLEVLPLDFPLISVDTASFARWGVIPPEGDAPLPATYIIDSRGIIRYLHLGRNASDRTTDAGLFAVLERLDLR